MTVNDINVFKSTFENFTEITPNRINAKQKTLYQLQDY